MRPTDTTTDRRWPAAAVVVAGVLMAAILPLMATSARAVVPAEGTAPGAPARAESAPIAKTPAALERGQERFAPGRVIVKFGREVGREARSDVRSEEGLQKGKDLGLIGAEVDTVSGRPVGEAVRDIEARPEVRYAEPDYKVYPSDYANEPRFGELWGLHNTGQDGGTPDVDVNGLQASGVTLGDENLVVAVIDDGVDFGHPDLADRAWVNEDEVPDNGIDDDKNGYTDDVNGYDFANDDDTVHDPGRDFHGTHVAGTIAASIDDGGVVGVAPNVKIMALKFLGPDGGYTSDAIEAIHYAKREGVGISNNSWGGGGPSRSLKAAIEASGSLFVAAAGNWGMNNDRYPDYPSSFDSRNIISVTAVNRLGRMTPWSNYGATSVDVSAPGVEVLSSVPGMPETSAAVLSPVGVSGRALTAGFGADEIGSAAGRASFFERAFEAVGHTPDQPVVLVDDDQSDSGDFPDAGRPIRTAIEDATGGAPQELDVPFDADGPSLAQLQGKTVVWATGWSFSSSFSDMGLNVRTTLTADDQTTLREFLGGGGKLIVTGMDALFMIEDSSLVTDTLGLDVMSDVGAGGESFEGAPGTAFDGASYAFDGPAAFAPYHDGVTPRDTPAVPGMASQGAYPAVGAGWEYFSGTSMAAPHVTGTAALVASASPAVLRDPAALKGAVMGGGKPLPATARKTVTGDMVDAKKSVDLPVIIAVTPAPGSRTEDRTPKIGAIVKDAAADLTKADVELRLDGRPRAAVDYDGSTGGLAFTPKKHLSFGKHTVTVQATDAAQNAGLRRWRFEVVEGR